MRSPRLVPSIVCGQVVGILCADLFAFLALAPIAWLGFALLVVRRLPRWFRASLGGALLAGIAHAAALDAAELDRASLPAGARTFDACIATADGSSAGTRYVFTSLRAADAGARLPKRVEWFPQRPPAFASERAPRAGDCFRLRARFRAIRSFANPGSRDRERAAARRGLAVRISLVGERWIVPVAPDSMQPVALLRAQLGEVRTRLADRFMEHGRAGGLLAALSVGDRRGLAPQDREAFAALGVAHVLAVSGLHLSLVAGLGFSLASALLRRLARRASSTPGLLRRSLQGGGDLRMLALGAAALSATLYALMSGPGIAALRAWIVVVAAAAGFALGRPGSLRSGFWLAAALLLGWDPASLFDLGAQLSFSATAALLYAAPLRSRDSGELLAGPSSPRADHAYRWAREAVHASACAIAATTPFLATSGLDVAPAGLLANLVAIPWVGLVVLPASLAAAGTAALPGAPGLDRLAEAVLRIALLAADATLGVAAAAAAWLPAGPAVGPTGLGLAMLSAGTACLCVRAASTPWRLAFCLLGVAIVRVPLPSFSHSPGAAPTFVAFDVGSGDALLLRAGGASVLVDGGLALEAGWASAVGYDIGEREVLPALQSLDVRALDVVVATHADADHVGGIPSILRALPVGELWLPAGQARDPGFALLLAAARDREIPVREVASGTPLRSLDPGLALEVLWPPAGGVRAAGSRNDASIVLRVQLGELRILLTGDLGATGEQMLLRSLGEPGSPADVAADILKVGHHGSATSSSARWLAAVAPSVAVVSAACGRSGLPAPSALARLGASGAAIWWTGLHGAVTIREAPMGRANARDARAPLVTARRLDGRLRSPSFRGDCTPG